jgi:hypothetical protein
MAIVDRQGGKDLAEGSGLSILLGADAKVCGGAHPNAKQHSTLQRLVEVAWTCLLTEHVKNADGLNG